MYLLKLVIFIFFLNQKLHSTRKIILNIKIHFSLVLFTSHIIILKEKYMYHNIVVFLQLCRKTATQFTDE